MNLKKLLASSLSLSLLWTSFPFAAIAQGRPAAGVSHKRNQRRGAIEARASKPLELKAPKIAEIAATPSHAERLFDGSRMALGDVTVEAVGGAGRLAQYAAGAAPAGTVRRSAPPPGVELINKVIGSPELPLKERLLNGGKAAVVVAAVGAALYSALTGSPAEPTGLLMGLGAIGAVATPENGGPSAPPGKNDGLKPYLIDMTAAARAGELSPTYLRDDEIGKIVRVLTQNAYNNVFLIGEPGVGKTAIAEGVAQRMAAGKTGTVLDGQRLLSLDAGKFIAASGAAPDRFAQEVSELLAIVSDGNTVLMIDEAHQLAKDPATGNIQTSFYDQLKPAMTKGKLKLILATTLAEHKKYFAGDAALESRSQLINVEPIAEAPAKNLLYRPEIRGQYENGVEISYEAVEAAVELTVRAFRFKALLRMAVQALDTASTWRRNRPAELESRILSARKDILYQLGLLQQSRESGNLKLQENTIAVIKPLLEDYLRYQEEFAQAPRTKILRSDVEEALQELGTPLHALRAGTKEHLANVESFLRTHLIGHDSLIDQTTARLKARFANPNSRQPILSALLLGATGTGKTEYARLLGRALWNIEDVEKSLIKYNGGELQEGHRISVIQGSPPGYVGFGETDTLMDRVRRKPQSVILMDEVEKMHPDILNLFLSILEDGAANDAQGRPVDFSNTILVFTSNFGVPPDFDSMTDEAFKEKVWEAIKKPQSPFKDLGSPFRPEFLGRLNVIDVFAPLKEEEVRKIIELRLKQLQGRWKTAHSIEVELADKEALTAQLLAEGYSRRKGARAMNQAIASRLDDPLSGRLIEQALERGDKAIIAADGAIQIEKAPKSKKASGLHSTNPAAQALSDRLEQLLGELKSGELLTTELLDEALNGNLPGGLGSWFSARGAQAEFAAEHRSDDLTQHRGADPALKDSLISLRTRLPEKWSDPVAKAAKVLVGAAKNINLEDTLRAMEGPNWTRSVLEMEQAAATHNGPGKEQLQKKLMDVLERTNSTRHVNLSWQIKKKLVKLKVDFDGRMPYDEEIRLCRLLGRNSADSSVPQDIELADLRRALVKAGGRIGYSKGKKGSSLWLEWPMTEEALPEPEKKPEKEKPEPRPAAKPEAKERKPAAKPADLGAALREAVSPLFEGRTEKKETQAAPKPAAEPIAVPVETPPATPAVDVMKLALSLFDPKTAPQTALENIETLERTIKDNPGALSPELEKFLREAINTFIKQVLGGGRGRTDTSSGYYDRTITTKKISDADAARHQGRWAPVRRVRAILDLYEGLIKSRPDLVNPATFDTLFENRRYLAPAAGDPKGNEVAEWTMKRLTSMAKTAYERRPDLANVNNLISFYEQVEKENPVLAKIPLGMRGQRALKHLGIASLIALPAIAVAAWIGGPEVAVQVQANSNNLSLFNSAATQMQYQHQFAHWLLPVAGAAEAALATVTSGAALVGTLLEKFKGNRTSANTRLTIGLFPQMPVQEVLESIAALDEESGIWKARSGRDSLFDRLKREWPEFKALADNRYPQFIRKTKKSHPMSVLEDIGVSDPRGGWKPKKGRERMFKALLEEWPAFKAATQD